jgi:myo-inositol-1(or 4)-monophosphatase
MLTSDQVRPFLAVAVRAATKGGGVLKAFWGKLEKIEEKSTPGDLVTEADKQSEREIIEVLKTSYPHHAILAEESGLHTLEKSDFLWAIDPLDGTTNYAHQFPFVAVSIALLHQGKPLVGVVYNPLLGELFTGGLGLGAFLNENPIRVSKTALLKNSLLATGFPYRRREIVENNYREFCHLTNLTQGVRRAGSASLDLAYVACGRFDGYWESELNPWDIAAGALLVEEAGGKVSAYDKSPLNIMKPKILATNGLLHDALSQEVVA